FARVEAGEPGPGERRPVGQRLRVGVRALSGEDHPTDDPEAMRAGSAGDLDAIADALPNRFEGGRPEGDLIVGRRLVAVDQRRFDRPPDWREAPRGHGVPVDLDGVGAETGERVDRRITGYRCLRLAE